jgi:hypothetical protein
MTGGQLKSFRIGRGMSVLTFARFLGMTGKRETVSARIRAMERGDKIVPEWVENTVELERREDDA